MEVNTRALTKLQPHFVGPWLFHSWNLSYNVSVEADRVADKYFFISRGIQLVAQGERQNRFHPDLRWTVGWYAQNKLCSSDETNTLRSLFQLSCIPPNERDPARFWVVRNGRQEINYEQFEDFCRKHPQLVRRLKEGMRRELMVDQRRQFTVQTPEALVQFLADNKRVPALYKVAPGDTPVGNWQAKQDDELLTSEERFPVLPPAMDQWDKTRATKWPPVEMQDGVLGDPREIHDEDDPYCVARSWYIFAQEPIPDPDDLPGTTKPIVDRAHQRKPRWISTVIFRGYPALGQLFTSERLEEEGWFDRSGWEIPDWFADWNGKFHDNTDATVGTGRAWAQDAWRRAYDYWQQHGERNHLLFPPGAEEARIHKLAEDFWKKYNLPFGVAPPNLRDESLPKEDREGLWAARFLRDYDQNRSMTNFPHHYVRTVVESREETIKARQLFYEADSYRLAGSPRRALAKYEDPHAITAWRDKVLLANKDYRRDPMIQEQSFITEMRYMSLLNDMHGKLLHRQAAGTLLLPVPVPGSGATPIAFTGWLPGVVRESWHSPLFGGPFDGTDNEGHPLIGYDVRVRVLSRRGQLGSGGAKGQAPPASGSAPSSGGPPQ